MIDEQGKSSNSQNAEDLFGAGPGLSKSDMDRALEVARDAVDAHTMAALRNSLDEFINRPGAKTLTRPNIVAVLRSISAGLGPSTDRTLAVIKTVEIVVASHLAIALLNEFIEVLEDLNSGKIHDALKPVTDGANSAKRWKRVGKRVQAGRFPVEHKRKAAKSRRDIEMTTGMLKSLRDHQKDPE